MEISDISGKNSLPPSNPVIGSGYKPFMVDGTGSNYVFKRLKSGDYTIRPITVKKTWEFTTNTSSINYY